MAREYENAAELFEYLGIVHPGLYSIRLIGEDRVLVQNTMRNNSDTLEYGKVMTVNALDDWNIVENDERRCIIDYIGDKTFGDSDEKCPVCNQEYVAHHEIEEDNILPIDLRDDFTMCKRDTSIVDDNIREKWWVHQ